MVRDLLIHLRVSGSNAVSSSNFTPGGRWRESLGEAGLDEVSRKERSDKKRHNALRYLHFYSKTRAKNYHPAGCSWPAGHEFQTPDLESEELLALCNPRRTNHDVLSHGEEES